jgi:predicted NBD/HSP70 family sugar kinase
VRAPDDSVKLIDDDRLRSRGTTQAGVRLYNERLVLSLIRAHGQLPKAEIARLTGLSPQTVSVIVRLLEADELVLKGKSVKGKVGQPLQPFSLNPDGAYAIGLKVGRRSGELMLVGLDGQVRETIREPYAFPTPAQFMEFTRRGLDILTARMSSQGAKRISGLGVAAPFDIWKWEEEAGAPHHVMEAWKQFDITQALQATSPWPVYDCNDATAACAAELFSGKGRALRDFAYIYCGYFVGGGIAIDGRIFQGPTGNAGAIGSLPVPGSNGSGSQQLIRSASLYRLERKLRQSGFDPSFLWENLDDWRGGEPEIEHWIATASKSLAHAAASLAATLECKAVIIDGAMPGHVRDRLVERTKAELADVNCDGITPFSIEAGTCGAGARALGAASLPLVANFMIDRDVLFTSSE